MHHRQPFGGHTSRQMNADVSIATPSTIAITIPIDMLMAVNQEIYYYQSQTR